MNNTTLQSTDNTMFYSCNNDRDWSLNRVSGNCRNVTGHEKNELMNGDVTIGQLISKQFREQVWQNVQLSLATKTPYVLNYTIEDSKKNKIIIYEQAQGMFSKENELIEIFGFMSNVTEQADDFIYEDRDKQLILLADELVRTAQETKGCKRVSHNLKNKELETLLLLCKGYSMKEVANVISASPRTIEMYIKNLRSKLCCYNKSELRNLFYATKVGPKIICNKRFFDVS